jgi:hypothetical protein
MQLRTRNQQKKDRKAHKAKGNRVNNLAYSVIITFAIIGIVNWLFWDTQIIGQDKRYNVYFIIMPWLFGFFILLFLSRRLLLPIISTQKTLGLKCLYIGWFTFLSIFCSYVTFGVAADMIWKYTNEQKASYSTNEVFESQVLKIVNNNGRRYPFARSYLVIRHSGKNETVYINSDLMETLRDREPKDCKLIYRAKKGLWDYYVLESFYVTTSG